MKTNSELRTDVLAELDYEPSVTATNIGVTVHDGVVTLTGHIPSYLEKYAAERAAKRVYGVKAVANELEVKLAGAKRSDEEIAAACLAALASHVSVPDKDIKVVVRGGLVVLEGEVPWRYQRDAAEAAVRDLIGVTSVSNAIKVQAPVSASNVKSSIEAAFRRNAEIDARQIIVETRDGTVILRGKVRSWAEMDEAQHAAWAAPGVTMVQNDLSIAI